MKKLLFIIILAVIAVATLPMWGSCDLNAQACSTWCSARYFNSDVKTATCKARCANDKLSCLVDRGSKGVEDFLNELQK